jgi:hypothetical protein
MGLIGTIFGSPTATTAIGNAHHCGRGVRAERHQKMQAAQDAYMAAIDEHGAGFHYAAPGA